MDSFNPFKKKLEKDKKGLLSGLADRGRGLASAAMIASSLGATAAVDQAKATETEMTEMQPEEEIPSYDVQWCQDNLDTVKKEMSSSTYSPKEMAESVSYRIDEYIGRFHLWEHKITSKHDLKFVIKVTTKLKELLEDVHSQHGDHMPGFQTQINRLDGVLSIVAKSIEALENRKVLTPEEEKNILRHYGY